MEVRKSIGQKIRFEVFKRDSFTCQYCGKSAPDVILEVDHIHPVSKGGTNDIFNLITSCRDCNRGKGKRLISDRDELKKQKEQLDELNERRKQMEMMIQWRESMINMLDSQVDEIEKIIISCSDGSVLTQYARNRVKKLIKEFGFNLVCECTETSFMQYFAGTDISWLTAFEKIGGICYNKQHGVRGYERR